MPRFVSSDLMMSQKKRTESRKDLPAAYALKFMRVFPKKKYKRVKEVVILCDQVFCEADAKHDNIVHHLVLVT